MKDFLNRSVKILKLAEVPGHQHERISPTELSRRYKGKFGVAVAGNHSVGYQVQMNGGVRLNNVFAGSLRLATLREEALIELEDQINELINGIAGDAIECMQQKFPGRKARATASGLAEIASDLVGHKLEERLESLKRSLGRLSVQHDIDVQQEAIRLWEAKSCRSILRRVAKKYI